MVIFASQGPKYFGRYGENGKGSNGPGFMGFKASSKKKIM